MNRRNRCVQLRLIGQAEPNEDSIMSYRFPIHPLRNALRCAIALVVAVTLVACQSSEEKLAEFYANGLAYDEDEMYLEAVIEYKNVIKLDPNHADAHYQLAKAYLNLGRARDAYWEMSETVRLDPTNIEAAMSFGALALIAADGDQALAMGLFAIEGDPENYQGHILTGKALEYLKRGSESEPYFLKAVELNPDDYDTLLVLASYYANSPDGREKAEPWFWKATELFKSFRSRTALAKFLVRDPERTDEAEAVFRKAVEKAKKPEYRVEGYLNLAKLYFSTQRDEDGVAALKKGIEDQKDSNSLLYMLATYYGSQEDLATAEELLRRATAKDTSNPEPFLILSSFLGNNERLEEALEAAGLALVADPDHVNAKLRRAEILVDLGYREASAEAKKTPNEDNRAALAEVNPKILEGLSVVEAVLAETPFQPQAEFVRGKAYLAKGETQKGIDAFRAAVESRPDWPQAHFALGSAIASQNESSLARVEIARALELDPGLHQARKLLATIHQALGEHEYAIEQGRRYLAVRPDSNDTRIMVAQSLIRLGKRDKALEELNKVPVDQRDASLLFALGSIHASLADPVKARGLLMQVLELSPNNQRVLRTLFKIDRHHEVNFAETKQLILSAAELSPDDSDFAQLHAMVLFANGNFAGAEAGFVRATELSPDDIDAHQQLARFYALTGRTDEQIETYEQAVAVEPTSARLHHRLALLYEAQGQLDLAQQSYENAIKYDENHAFAKNNLAYLLADTGKDLDRALDLAQDAKALLPNDANAADTLGWVLFKRGVNGAAVGYLKESLDNADADDPVLGVIRHHLAQAYEADGNMKRAAEVLRASINDLEQRNKAERAQGRDPQSPPWESDVRSMLDRLTAG
jgi:tetratricopeptide (TPR) repeat protein